MQKKVFLKLKQNQSFRIDNLVFLLQNSIHLKTNECDTIKGKIHLDLINLNIFYKLSFNFKEKEISFIFGKEKESLQNLDDFVKEFTTSIKNQFIHD